MAEESMLELVQAGKGLTFTVELNWEGFDALDQQIRSVGEELLNPPDRLILESSLELEDVEAAKIAGVKQPGDEPQAKDWYHLVPGQDKMRFTRRAEFPAIFWVNKGKLAAWIRSEEKSAVVTIAALEAHTDADREEVQAFTAALHARNAGWGLQNPFAPVEEKTQQETAEYICPECGKPFAPTRTDQIYDTPQCATRARVREHRKRKKASPPVMPLQICY